jgi:hypothetical protein
MEHQSGRQSWHVRSRWWTALGDQIKAAAVEHEQAVGVRTGKRGMDFDAEVTNLTMGCSGPGQAWRSRPARCVLHQGVCVKSAEIDDPFYASLGISR